MVTPVFGSAGPAGSKSLDLDEVFSGENLVVRSAKKEPGLSMFALSIHIAINSLPDSARTL